MLAMGGLSLVEGLLVCPLVRIPKLQQPFVVVVEKVESIQQVVIVHCVETTFDESHPYEGIGE